MSYLLLKRGLYYGPDNRGYTGIKDRAGRYLESDADELSGVTAIHEDEAPMFSPACWEDVKVKFLLDRIGKLETQNAAMRSVLEGCDHFSDAVAYRDDTLSVALRQWLNAIPGVLASSTPVNDRAGCGV